MKFTSSSSIALVAFAFLANGAPIEKHEFLPTGTFSHPHHHHTPSGGFTGAPFPTGTGAPFPTGSGFPFPSGGLFDEKAIAEARVILADYYKHHHHKSGGAFPTGFGGSFPSSFPAFPHPTGTTGEHSHEERAEKEHHHHHHPSGAAYPTGGFRGGYHSGFPSSLPPFPTASASAHAGHEERAEKEHHHHHHSGGVFPTGSFGGSFPTGGAIPTGTFGKVAAFSPFSGEAGAAFPTGFPHHHHHHKSGGAFPTGGAFPSGFPAFPSAFPSAAAGSHGHGSYSAPAFPSASASA